MAGHSKFKNIQHRKEAQDRKRTKIFNKLIRDIITAAKSGMQDLESNHKLRSAVAMAKSFNVPKDKIDRAIKSSHLDKTNYEDIRYEGFLHGVAFIVEATTDNKNRTAAEIRSIFNKVNGNLAEVGSVSFMFNHVGIIHYNTKNISEEQITHLAIELGAIEVLTQGDNYIIYTEIDQFNSAVKVLRDKLGVAEDFYLGWVPLNKIEIISQDTLEKIKKLINLLEDNESVERVFNNLLLLV